MNESGKSKIRTALRVLRENQRAEEREIKQEITYLKKHVDKIWEGVSNINERLQTLEIQFNRVSCLVATLAIEKLGMKAFGLVRMIKEIKKELLAEGQI